MRKVSIDEKMQTRFDCINGDFKKLKGNPNIDLLIHTLEDALAHIHGTLKDICGEITEINKQLVNIPKSQIL
jgi:hypothetical protein